MGVLERTTTRERVALTSRAMVGRASVCRVRLANHHASAEHGALAWSAAGWTVRDLASTNGTWLDGVRLTAGRRTPLAIGAVLIFGDPTDPWCLIDEGPPAAAAWDRDDDRLVAATELAIDLGDAVVRFGADGWRLRQGADERPVADGESITVGNKTWVLLLPPPEHQTRSTRPRAPTSPLATSSLEIRVSSDEEHVDLSLRTARGAAVSLPPGKSCYYVLLTLARLQIAAQRRGSDWVSVHELSDALRYSVERLNVEIHRARKLLAGAGIPDAFSIVERTRDGRLRIGAREVIVQREASGI